MKKITLFFIIYLLSVTVLCAQEAKSSLVFKSQNPSTSPLQEVRAVWLTTIGGIDWPHSYAHEGYGIGLQQKELCGILDKLVEAGVNTVLLQTRIRATTIFPSSMEPWDGCLSGRPGVSPGYDALAFAIDECHKRGMKIHAWVVSIPVGKWNGAGCNALRKRYPGMVKRIGDEGFMNPESGFVADYLAAFCKEIAVKYDVDGIHLDYIRYPETWGKISNKDRARSNITHIVKRVHDEVKAVKPWVAMSCSPVGKYADTKRAWARGWTARDAVCQDVALWLQQGYMDMVFPMMYFRGRDFYPFVVDWKERSNGRVVVPGLGIYFMHPNEKNWSLGDITREMFVSRSLGMGTSMFRSKFFTDDTKGLYGFVKHTYSQDIALQPAMTWYGVEPPRSPQGLQADVHDGNVKLSWDAVGSGNSITYNVYCMEDGDEALLSQNLLAAYLQGNSVTLPVPSHVCRFAVTANDRYNNESEASCVSFGVQNTYAEGHEMLFVEANRVYLDGCDVEEEQLVELRSLIGTMRGLRIVKSAGGRLYIDVAGVTVGYSKVYLVGRNGGVHLLGQFFLGL